MRLLSWHNTHPQPNITPMIWVQPFEPTNADGSNVNPRSASDEADKAAKELLSRNEDDRVVFFNWAFGYPTRENLARRVAAGFDIAYAAPWYAEFFERIKKHGATIARIVLDYEMDMGYWSTVGTFPAGEPRTNAVQDMLDWKPSLARLSEQLQRTPDDEFSDRETIIEWDRWAAPQARAAVIKAICYPAKQVFGDAPAITNYEWNRSSFPVFDRETWPVPDQALTEESSPELYCWGGARYANLNKSPRWNRLIDCLNYVRSAKPIGPVLPWVGSPIYDPGNPEPHRGGSIEWWKTLMRHLHFSGVKDVLYHNPDPSTTAEMEKLASEFVGELNTCQPCCELKLEEIPLDADEIRTGCCVTWYQGFEEGAK